MNESCGDGESWKRPVTPGKVKTLTKTAVAYSVQPTVYSLQCTAYSVVTNVFCALVEAQHVRKTELDIAFAAISASWMEGQPYMMERQGRMDSPEANSIKMP